MAAFLLDALIAARRVRDAIREIQRLPVGDRDKKNLLSEWFQEHTGAATSPEGIRRKGEMVAAYDKLLGRARNARLRG